mmetsp:Transcript_104426/g.234426  ORF Transcript_104426/g.234426 Transcript_104426/m.234426 type:complete len:265 (-) Transcript_104426:62-856(-)
MTTKERKKIAVASSTCSIMASPRARPEPARSHCKPKKTLQAKPMLSTVTAVCIKRRCIAGRSCIFSSVPKTAAANSRATMSSAVTSRPPCPARASSGSSPSSSGSAPLMRKRAAWTVSQESVRPATSFSASAACSSQSSSCSSFLPSSLKETLSRTFMATFCRSSWPPTATGRVRMDAKGDELKSCVCCKLLQKLMDAKPVMCAKSTAKHLMFASASSIVTFGKPSSLIAPEVTASVNCSIVYHVTWMRAATRSLNPVDAPSRR